MNTSSPWTLPQLIKPARTLPAKRTSAELTHPQQLSGLRLAGSHPRLQDIPSRDCINTAVTSQRDKTDMIRRGGR